MNHAADLRHDEDAAAVARRGASLAFRNRPSPAASDTLISRRQLHKSSSDLEALSAATSAGRAMSPLRSGTIDAHASEASVPDVDLYSYQGGIVAARLHQLGSSPGSSQLQPPSNRVDPNNPSFIAATLAASRNASPSSTNRTPRRIASTGTISVSSGGDAVDSEPIHPTGSLISMFERSRGDNDPNKKSPGRRSLEEPKPTRPLTKAIPPLSKSSVGPSKPETASRGPGISQQSPVVKPKPTSMQSPRQSLGVPPESNQSNTVVHSTKPRRRSPTPARAVTQTEGGPMKRAVNPLSVDDTSLPAPLPPRQRRPSPSPSSTRPVSTTPASKLLYGLPIAAFKADTPSPKPPRTSPSSNTHESISSSNASSVPHALSPQPVISRSTPEVLSPKPKRFVKTPLQAGLPMPIDSGSGSQITSSPSPSPDPQKRSTQPKPQPPTPPLPRGSRRLVPPVQTRRRGNSDSRTGALNKGAAISTNGSSSSASPHRPPGRDSPPPLPRRKQSIASAPPSPTHEVPRRRLTNVSTSNLQVDSLTNAIMAGSLAASRLTPHNTGTSLPPPSLPKRQKSPHLLQTLRQPVDHSEEDTDHLKRGHRHKLQSGKHSHHEGSRKRWRDQITDRERKRYEGIWASNRGLLLTDVSPSASVGSSIGRFVASEFVVNVVVREIWRRSRLPIDELSEVWDLVDRDHRGALSKQEFVVGTWLIDQRLRGRKLPTRVGDSVWGSANGMSVKRPKQKAR